MTATTPRGRRAKGMKAQHDALVVLRAQGFRAVTPAVEHADLGDVLLIDHGVVAQVKHYDDLPRAIREALAGAATQAGRLDAVGFGIVRPPGRPHPNDMIVCIRLGDFADFVHALQSHRSENES